MRVADIFASLLSFDSFKLRYEQLHREYPQLYPVKAEDLEEKHYAGFVQFVFGGYSEGQQFIPAAASKGPNVIVQSHLKTLEFHPLASKPSEPKPTAT